MIKEFVQSNNVLLQKPIFTAKFGHSWFKLLKTFGQIFHRNISLGNVAVVKSLEEILASSLF